MSEELPTSFEMVAAELRKLGLAIRRLPGEYSINFVNAAEATARFADDLGQILEIGRAMAAEAAADKRAAIRRPKRRKRWRKQTTPKARRRRFIRAHNRRIRAKALRRRPAD